MRPDFGSRKRQRQHSTSFMTELTARGARR
jgi:hypothetical protein